MMIGMKGKTKQSKAIPTPGHINPHTLMNEVCSPSKKKERNKRSLPEDNPHEMLLERITA